MTYTYDEIIPENENARLVCEDLSQNHHVKFPVDIDEKCRKICIDIFAS